MTESCLTNPARQTQTEAQGNQANILMRLVVHLRAPRILHLDNLSAIFALFCVSASIGWTASALCTLTLTCQPIEAQCQVSGPRPQPA